MRAYIVFMLWLAGAAPAFAEAPADARPELLKALDGRWVMTGDVMNEPVTYDLEAGPTLAHAFTELHMTDVQVPAQYEARVFLGWDAERETVIVHWLDSFGGKFSIPHGTGTLEGDTIRFDVPYADGPFRDTFSYDRTSGTWRFTIEAGQADGSWRHFAAYDLRRR